MADLRNKKIRIISGKIFFFWNLFRGEKFSALRANFVTSYFQFEFHVKENYLIDGRRLGTQNGTVIDAKNPHPTIEVNTQKHQRKPQIFQTGNI